MASILLAEAQKLGLDDLSAGVAETVATADMFTQVLPFNVTSGNAYVYNREGTPGNVGSFAIGGATTGVKTQVTFSQIAVPLTSIIGDAEVNDLIVAQGVGANVGTSPTAASIASKAKQVNREFMRMVAVGNVASPGNSVSGVANGQEFNGIETLFDLGGAFAGQDLDQANATLTLDMLDAMLHAVLKGDPAFIMCHSKGVRKIRSLIRALGGVNTIEVNGKIVDAFNGVPILRNDYLSADTVGGTAGNQINIYAGSFDDGTRTGGCAGVLADVGGVQVTAVGPAEAGDYNIWRVKMYGSFAIHSPLSVSRLKAVTV